MGNKITASSSSSSLLLPLLRSWERQKVLSISGRLFQVEALRDLLSFQCPPSGGGSLRMGSGVRLWGLLLSLLIPF